MSVAEAPASKPLISLDDEAVRQSKLLIQKKGDPSLFVRMGVKGGGCSGLSYVLKLDNKLGPHDREFEFDGLKVVVDKKSLIYLAGTELVYTGNLVEGGFEFRNPNAKRSCGCGTSFVAA